MIVMGVPASGLESTSGSKKNVYMALDSNANLHQYLQHHHILLKSSGYLVLRVQILILHLSFLADNVSNMTFSKAFVLALALATAVHAKPISNPPTRVVARQAPPEPSSYPLGDACTNEWRYLNFDPENETDKAHLELLHNILCIGEMLAITSYGAGAAESALMPYLRHFAVNEEQDDPDERPDEYHFQDHVKNVLNRLAGDGQNNVKLGEVVGSFVVDNKGKLDSSALR